MLPRQLAIDLATHGDNSCQFRVLRLTDSVEEAQQLCDRLVAAIDPKQLYWPRRDAPEADSTQPTVYLLVAGSAECPTKVGITGNPEARLRSYQTSSAERDFRFYHTWPVATMADARRVEAAVLDAAASAGWGRRNEWVFQPAQLLASLIEESLATASVSPSDATDSLLDSARQDC